MSASSPQPALPPTPGVYRAFLPKEGDYLVVQLPGEMARCPVQKVVTVDAVLVKLDKPPTSRTHSFRLDDIFGARRRLRDGRDVWEAQNDREFLAEQARITARTAQPKKKAAKRKSK